MTLMGTKKHRLFVFGDSFVPNSFQELQQLEAKGVEWANKDGVLTYVKEYFTQTPLHWTDYLSKWFDIHNYGYYGASNESIIYQLGFLPEFQQGDRIVIVFSSPSRIRRVRSTPEHFDKDRNPLKGIHRRRDCDYVHPKPGWDVGVECLEKLFAMRMDAWDEGYRDDEINFYRVLKDNLLSKYQPAFITWSHDLQNVDFIKSANLGDYIIVRVTDGKVKDGHFGAYGNFLFYKQIHELLQLPFEQRQYEDYSIDGTL